VAGFVRKVNSLLHWYSVGRLSASPSGRKRARATHHTVMRIAAAIPVDRVKLQIIELYPMEASWGGGGKGAGSGRGDLRRKAELAASSPR